jgi:hypothetical protein
VLTNGRILSLVLLASTFFLTIVEPRSQWLVCNGYPGQLQAFDRASQALSHSYQVRPHSLRALSFCAMNTIEIVLLFYLSTFDVQLHAEYRAMYVLIIVNITHICRTAGGGLHARVEEGGEQQDVRALRHALPVPAAPAR